MILKLGMEHYVLKLYKVYINDDPELTTTYFTTTSNLAKVFLLHLLIAGCDIEVKLSVHLFVRPSVNNSCQCGFLCSSDSWEYETLHSNCP